MVTVDSAALSTVLDAVDLRVGVARRAALPTGGLLPLGTGAAALVYVARGTVHGHPPLRTGCRLDVDRASQTVAVDERPPQATLTTGDAFLTLGRTAFALEADDETELVVVDLEFADSSSLLAAVLPDPITVMSFDALEPAAAALAGSSPADYVTEVRIDAAKRMLGTGRSVSETSRELGYASDEGFSRAFRRRTGMTPSAWRSAHALVPA